jgi:hypothetical protein
MRILLLSIAASLAVLTATTSTHAHGFGTPRGPVVVAHPGPHPVVVAPRNVVVAPRPVVVTPRPVVVNRPPVVVHAPPHVVTPGWHAGVATGPFGAVAAPRPHVAFPHATGYVHPTILSNRAAFVRSNYHGPRFSPRWYGLHPRAWAPARWGLGGLWALPAWTTIAPFCGIGAAPILYDYGSNVVLDNGSVYVNGAPTATAPQYADQAIALCNQGVAATVSNDEQWQPLGVFGVTQADDQPAQDVFQLAVNRAGIIRGNYINTTTNETKPVEGAIDRATQRVAWLIDDRRSVVYETGLNNLMQPVTSVLVHYGDEQTVQMSLVRIEQPPEAPR